MPKVKNLLRLQFKSLLPSSNKEAKNTYFNKLVLLKNHEASYMVRLYKQIEM